MGEGQITSSSLVFVSIIFLQSNFDEKLLLPATETNALYEHKRPLTSTSANK